MDADSLKRVVPGVLVVVGLALAGTAAYALASLPVESVPVVALRALGVGGGLGVAATSWLVHTGRKPLTPVLAVAGAAASMTALALVTASAAIADVVRLAAVVGIACFLLGFALIVATANATD